MQPAQTRIHNPIPLYALFIANAISLVGNVFTMVAIPWFVLQTTASATQTGITGFFAILPVVLAGFFSGTLIDRLGYKSKGFRQTCVGAFSERSPPVWAAPCHWVCC